MPHTRSHYCWKIYSSWIGLESDLCCPCKCKCRFNEFKVEIEDLAPRQDWLKNLLIKSKYKNMSKQLCLYSQLLGSVSITHLNVQSGVTGIHQCGTIYTLECAICWVMFMCFTLGCISFTSEWPFLEIFRISRLSAQSGEQCSWTSLSSASHSFQNEISLPSWNFTVECLFPEQCSAVVACTESHGWLPLLRLSAFASHGWVHL